MNNRSLRTRKFATEGGINPLRRHFTMLSLVGTVVCLGSAMGCANSASTLHRAPNTSVEANSQALQREDFPQTLWLDPQVTAQLQNILGSKGD